MTIAGQPVFYLAFSKILLHLRSFSIFLSPAASNASIETTPDSTKSLIARGLQRHFRKIIDHTIWWNIEIDWILILALIEGDEAEAYERHMFFDDIALVLNEEIPQA
jgi:hypothetical protein